ncbi:hypothetical protein DFH06DRAFT_1406502, partial [Mycena polygramma]
KICHCRPPLTPPWQRASKGGRGVTFPLPHCTRWEHVKLQLTLSDLPLGSSLPMLRQLELQVPIRSDSPFRGALPPVPLLRAATLWDFRCPSDLLPWSQLTSLIVITKPASDCTTILQQTVNLVHCELMVNADGTSQPDIHLPRLESLVLGSHSRFDDPARGYLSSFIVPTLIRLQIPEVFIEPNPIRGLSAFIAKSHCKLEELRMTGERSLSAAFYRKHLPSISHITFNMWLENWLSGGTVDERRSMEDFEYE